MRDVETNDGSCLFLSTVCLFMFSSLLFSSQVVITARPESEVTELMQKQYPKPLLTKQLIPMDEEGKREMVSSILGNYNKQLDPKQMDLLLSKHSSSSYYWSEHNKIHYNTIHRSSLVTVTTTSLSPQSMLTFCHSPRLNK